MEILVEVHEDDAKAVAKMMELKMIEAFNHYADSVPMKVDAVISDHWVH
jgi:DNA polymerase I-like protein with 3'-5' exonuclease and polymerase domains